MGGLVSIEWHSVPGIDLTRIPKHMRWQCEPVAEKDRKNNRLFHHMDGSCGMETKQNKTKTLTIVNRSRRAGGWSDLQPMLQGLELAAL